MSINQNKINRYRYNNTDNVFNISKFFDKLNHSKEEKFKNFNNILINSLDSTRPTGRNISKLSMNAHSYSNDIPFSILNRNNSKLEKISQEISTNKNHMEDISRTLNLLLNNYSQNSQLKNQNEKILDNTSKLISQLKEEINILMEENVELNNAIDFQMSEIDRLTDVNNNLKNEICVLKNEITNLGYHLDQKDKEIASKSFYINQLIDAMRNLKVYKGSCTDVENKKTINEMEFDLKVISAEKAFAENERNSMESKINQLVDANIELNDEFHAYKTKAEVALVDLDNKNRNLENEISKLLIENSKLEIFNQKYQKDIDYLIKEQKEMDNKLKEHLLSKTNIEEQKKIELKNENYKTIENSDVKNIQKQKEIINNLYNKIQQYKKRVKKERESDKDNEC